MKSDRILQQDLVGENVAKEPETPDKKPTFRFCYLENKFGPTFLVLISRVIFPRPYPVV